MVAARSHVEIRDENMSAARRNYLGAVVDVTSEVADAGVYSDLNSSLLAAGIPAAVASQVAQLVSVSSITTPIDIPTYVKGFASIYIPASQHISQADAIKGAMQGALQMSAQRGAQGVIVGQANPYKALAIVNPPRINLQAISTPIYTGLSSRHPLFAGLPFNTPILQPHLTNALNWCAPGDGILLNIGDPTDLYDPVEYLRSALVDSDWERVKYWFGTFYSQIYTATGPKKDPYYPFGALNIFDYKYTVTNGVKTYWPFSYYDLQQFITQIMANFMLTDTGQHDQVIFGFIDYNGAQRVDPALLPGNGPMIQLALHSLPDAGSSILAIAGRIATQGPGSSAREVLRVGWISAPPGPWDWGAVFSVITTFATFYFVGGAVFGWLAHAFSTITSIPVATADVATTAASTETSVAEATATVAADTLDTVVVTGSIGSAALSTVGGAITAVASVPVIANTISTSPNAPNIEPSLDEVIVNGTQSATISTGAGTITAVATVPVTAAIITSAPSDALDEVVVQGHAPATSTLSNAGIVTAVASVPVTTAASTSDVLDEVVVQGSAPTTTPTSSTPGIVSATAASAASVSSTTQSGNNSSNDSNNKSWEDYLKALVKKYGLAYVQKYLQSLIAKKLGRQPTASELQQLSDMLNSDAVSGDNSGSTNIGLLIALAGLGAILMGKRS